MVNGLKINIINAHSIQKHTLIHIPLINLSQHTSCVCVCYLFIATNCSNFKNIITRIKCDSAKKIDAYRSKGGVQRKVGDRGHFNGKCPRHEIRSTIVFICKILINRSIDVSKHLTSAVINIKPFHWQWNFHFFVFFK